MQNDLKIICLESKAFYSLIDEVVDRIKDKHQVKEEWIDTDGAMKLLKISSKSTLQKLRDNGEIRFSQPMKKHIVYYRPSVLDYLERHAKETF